MPRITRTSFPPKAETETASMRPGRNAPDNMRRRGFNIVKAKASMRPGRNAPDNEIAKYCDEEVDGASMRPGRNAPDNLENFSSSPTYLDMLQ